MTRDDFDELWSKTNNSVLFGIAAKSIKGKKQINELLYRMVWENAWGDKKLVPPERKFINDLMKEESKKAALLEEALSSVSIGSSLWMYFGISLLALGILLLFILPGMWKIISGIMCVAGIVMALYDAIVCNNNPRKAASTALQKTKDKCDRILL